MNAEASAGPSNLTVNADKRRKVARACDGCRAKKLRCIYSDTGRGSGPCARCEKLGLKCEALQPAKIDPRRLEQLAVRIKTDEDREALLQRISERGVYTSSRDTPRKRRATSSRPAEELLQRIQGTYQSPGIQESKLTTVEPRMQGSTATISILEDIADDSAVAEHRQRYRVFRIGDDWVFTGNINDPIIDHHLSNQTLVADFLIRYQSIVAPIYPVVSPSRVMEVARTSTLITLAMIAVASLDRHFPAQAFLGIRAAFKRAQTEYADRGSNFAQIQALLISGMSHEVHGETNMEGGSIAWLNIGSAIRRAFDLGLHRLDPGHWRGELYADRMSAWFGCIAADRCYALAYGHPQSINLQDCGELSGVTARMEEDGTSEFRSSLHTICEIMGAILQLLYRPNAWSSCTNNTISMLQDQLDAAIESIPESVSFHGQSTSRQGGLLSLITTCTEVIFYRPFVRPLRTPPPHITFRPRPSRWYLVIQRARAVMSWMDAQGDALLDCWLFTKVAVAYASLALYFHCLSTRDAESLRALGTARDFMDRWAKGHRMDKPMASRSKIADIVSVLYAAASKPMDQAIQINDTAGTYHVDTSGSSYGNFDGSQVPRADLEILSDISGAIPADFDLDSLLQSIMGNQGGDGGDGVPSGW